MVPDIGLEWTSTLETYRVCVGQACSAVHLEWSRVQSVVSKSGLFLSVLQNIHTWHWECPTWGQEKTYSPQSRGSNSQVSGPPSLWKMSCLTDSVRSYTLSSSRKSFILSRHFVNKCIFPVIPSGFVEMSENILVTAKVSKEGMLPKLISQPKHWKAQFIIVISLACYFIKKKQQNSDLFASTCCSNYNNS